MEGKQMTVSYLDTIAAIKAAEGLTYGEMTKAMRVHVRSLRNDDIVRSFFEDGTETTLDDPEGQIWFTTEGANYVDMLIESGLIAPVQEAAVQPKRRKTRRRKTTKGKTVPAPSDLVESLVLPKGEKARRVPGNQHGDQLWIPTPKELDANKKIEDLERKVSALMAVLAS